MKKGSTPRRIERRIAGIAAIGGVLLAGTAQANPLTVQRTFTTTGMNEQTTSYENAVWDAVATRFVPLSPAIAASQDADNRFWWQNDLRHLDVAGTSAHGVAGSILIGFDRRVSPDLVIGGFGGYSETDTNTELLGLGGTFEAQSFGFGLYAGYRLGAGVAADVFAAYTFSDTEYNQGGLIGSSDSDRVTAGVGLSAQYDLAGIIFAPRASVSITQDWSDAYADQFGTPVSSRDATLFRGYLGARAGTTFDTGGYSLSPWLAAGVEFTADDAGSASKVDDGASGRFGAGMSVPIGAALLTLEANTSGVGSNDYVDFGGVVTISYAFN